MSWHVPYLDQLVSNPCRGYLHGSAIASEPTALAAIALAGWGRFDAANRAAKWLAKIQARDGSVGVRGNEPTPRWPTGLAVLAWLSVAKGETSFGREVERALSWMLQSRSKPLPRGGAMQHDTTLVAWPWVEGTHAWVEPTAFNVLAMKAAGNHLHARTREAVRMLLDRQLPGGGCNYGNTLVLGKPLRAHLLPTGLAMLALIGEDGGDPRMEKSLTLLRNRTSSETPAISLVWSLLGLTVHDRRPKQADDWLRDAAERDGVRQSPLQSTLLLLAALGPDLPLATLCAPPQDNNRSIALDHPGRGLDPNSRYPDPTR